MLGRGLQQGSRVRACVATAFVALGAKGCVLGAWPTIPHAYEVRFDGQFQPWLMWEEELERIEVEDVAAVRCVR